MIILHLRRIRSHKISAEDALVTTFAGTSSKNLWAPEVALRRNTEGANDRRFPITPVLRLLHHPVKKDLFISFCEENFCQESVFFLIEVMEMRKVRDEEKLLETYRRICKRYIDDRSELTINISSDVKSKLTG